MREEGREDADVLGVKVGRGVGVAERERLGECWLIS